MTLSEHERRALDEIEGMLSADDPKLASALGSRRGKRSIRAVLAVVAVLGGLGLVLLGLLLGNVIGIALGVAGFAATVAGCALGVQLLRPVLRRRGRD
ncbi:MAG TPA: DUF3040 domain-containing protein [Jatrophihabitans sp.]|nr:DUF3040 domain-containing protein [Jatrophihabitans sp.]